MGVMSSESDRPGRRPTKAGERHGCLPSNGAIAGLVGLAALVTLCVWSARAPERAATALGGALRAGMTLREAVELVDARRDTRLRLDVEVGTDVGQTDAGVYRAGRLELGEGGGVFYPRAGFAERLSLAEGIARLEAEVAAVTTAPSWRLSIGWPMQRDTQAVLEVELGPDGRVTRVVGARTASY